MEVIILDEVVLDQIVLANDLQRQTGAVASHGVHIALTDENDKSMFAGIVHPNVKYEYEVQ